MLLKRGESRVKLIDFGLSRQILPGTICKDMIGTPEFVGEWEFLMGKTLRRKQRGNFFVETIVS